MYNVHEMDDIMSTFPETQQLALCSIYTLIKN